MRKRMFANVQLLDKALDVKLHYSRLLNDERDSIFVLVSILLFLTVVPSALWLVRSEGLLV